MPDLLINNVTEPVMKRLNEQATAHGRTPQAEAMAILERALLHQAEDVWKEVDAIYQRLAATGRSFSDSAQLLREDRDR